MDAAQHTLPLGFGDPRVPMRLWAKVQPDPVTGCWQWTGKTDGYKGTYGGAWWKGRNVRVHRLFFALLAREPLPTEHVHHACRNRRCVNPEHMEAIPQEEHWGHGHADKTHCPRGHEYTPENTKLTYTVRGATGRLSPNRNCRTCSRERPKRKKES